MADSGVESSTVPVKVTQPEPGAPPTLAEPASGPAAEMSGALPPHDKSESASVPASASAASIGNAKVNGTSESASASIPERPITAADPPASEAAPLTEDTEMKDVPEPETTVAPETNGTPSEKKTPAGKRKSTGGVPEHKGKKLNKKKSMPKITHLDAQPGDYYFARLKSYPPWPSIICDEDMLPTSLLSTRPITTKKDDGTYNEAYADGGKKVTDRTYPIMFLFTNEFAWIPNTDLTPLDPAECKDVPSKSKTKALIAAYEVAAEGHDLAHFKDMLQDHANAMREEVERKEAREAEKVAKETAKTEKKKRKSEVKPAADDVEMADADAEPKKASKKRKKDAESDEEEPEKPAKTPKTTKIKLTTNKTPATTEKKAKEPKSAKPKSEKKSKKGVAEEEAAPAVAEPEPKPLDPVEERKAREKEVLFLRHKLQKGFLGRDQFPREDEMPQMSNFIKKLEGYPELEVSIIRATKINKVLKALLKLNTIPRDEEFQFKKRSVELLEKWNKILGTEPAEAESADKDVSKDKPSPATNGTHEEKAGEKKDDAEESKENIVDPSEAVEKISAEIPVDAGVKATMIESVSEITTPAVAEGDKVEESKKDEGVIERAPESAAAAAQVQEVVKATE